MRTNGTSELGVPLLHAACKRNDPLLVSLLLKSGANVNMKSQYGETALHLAAKQNLHGVAIILLDNNADTAIFDQRGYAAPHCCGTREQGSRLLAANAGRRRQHGEVK